MVTRKQTVSVRLDDPAKKQVERAAALTRQSLGAFLEKAGEDRARQVLLDWAIDTYRQGKASFGELAQDTGLAVEEIMTAMGTGIRDETVEVFLASCRTVADMQQNPRFLRIAEEVAEYITGCKQEGHDAGGHGGSYRQLR